MLLFLGRPTVFHDDSMKTGNYYSVFFDKLHNLHNGALKTNLITKCDLLHAFLKLGLSNKKSHVNVWYGFFLMLFIIIATPIFFESIAFLFSVRCFLPNNFVVLEATRPINDCGFCINIHAPLKLHNISKEEFSPLAYSSMPIVIKNAVAHWPALEILNYTYLKSIYYSEPTALNTTCKFFTVTPGLRSLKDLFELLSDIETLNRSIPPIYVGWINCNPNVLKKFRKLYSRPHFLPNDAETPSNDFILLGYEQVAIMHLDYAPRILWQAQIQGKKNLILSPKPECDHLCNSFSFCIYPGDAVLMDTSIWHLGTSIPKGQFSITIQSEYG